MQVLLNGLISGLAIAILAFAFAIVYLPTRVFHIALGGIYVAVPFIALSSLSAGIPWPLAILAALMVGTGLSIGCELLNHNRLARMNAPAVSHLLSSLGIYIAIVEVIILVWGNEARVLREGPGKVITLLSFSLTHGQVLTATVSLALILTSYLWLHFSNVGLQFRAHADSPKELVLRGHSSRLLRGLAFTLSGFLCSASSLVIAYDMGFDPHEGLSTLLLAIAAVLIGGRDSFVGPLLGGVLVGVLRASTLWFLSARWQEAATFVLLILVLYLRPYGLVGKKQRMEEEA